MDLGGNIKKARQEAGITQKELAERLEVYQKDVCRWEKGKRIPGAIKLAEICKELDVSADELLELKIRK